MLTISITRTGGFAGVRRSWLLEVENEPEVQEWCDIVDACPWDDRPRPTAGADRYLYRIAADGREATVPEAQLVGPWRELVNRVRDAAPDASDPASVRGMDDKNPTPAGATPAGEDENGNLVPPTGDSGLDSHDAETEEDTNSGGPAD